MRHLVGFVAACAAFLLSPSLPGAALPGGQEPPRVEDKGEEKKKAPNPVCQIKTSLGLIEVELFPDSAPLTVKNFLGLAEGTREFTDPKTKQKVKRPYYDGLIFHRVIKGFMIQGGCPQGTGRGGPGFRFKDEINAKGLGLDRIPLTQGKKFNPQVLRWCLIRSQQDVSREIITPLAASIGIKSQDQFKERQKEFQALLNKATLKDLYEAKGYKYDDKLKARKPVKGVLAMANSGPNTNGSQFFINLGDTPHLTGKHTVFGRVIGGMAVVERIGAVKVDDRSRPVKAVKILSIRRK